MHESVTQTERSAAPFSIRSRIAGLGPASELSPEHLRHVAFFVGLRHGLPLVLLLWLALGTVVMLVARLV